MMDYLSQLGSLALGSRLKRLSERLNLEVAAIYQQKEFSFEPRLFPVFHFLGQNGENAITDIARAIDVTHPAVNQVASEMLSAGIIVQVASASDKRRRLLSLSKKGQKIFDEMESSWRLIRMSINQAIEESSHDIVTAIQALEQSLDKADLPSRFAQNEQLLKNAKVEIIEFDPAYRDDFRLLNENWIRKYFKLEAADTLILSSPEKIIEDGGTVFFARVCGRTIGTCALIKVDEQTFELAKMAVADEYQGLGAGRMLLEACITKAKSKAAKFVTLETNTKLESAVRLYKKAGFKPMQKNEAAPSKYARVNLVMKLEL